MAFRTRTRRPAGEPLPADPVACREAALRLLDRSRRTRADLAGRLREKGHATEVIEPVLDRLAQVGLVDDAEYARAWLAGRWGRRAAGWTRLRQELRGRGVSDDDIEAARTRLAEHEGRGADEVETARRVVSQAARRYASLEPRVRQQRLYALLARRGFDGDTIRRALALAEAGGEE
jgi:regulatory protein